MKVVTFNIRCDYGQDGLNIFDNRKGLIKKALAKYQPDIIGFQEVLPHVMAWLETNLDGYTVVGCGRDADLNGEYMTIAFKKDLFTLLNLETFWLSDTPDIAGSRYQDQSTCPRTCTVAMLKEKASGTLTRVYCTHLDHETVYARKQGLSLIVDTINADVKKRDCSTILLGDFNAEPNDDELTPLNSSNGIKLSDVTANIDFTFHDFQPEKNKVKIDYIFVSPDLKCKRAFALEDSENGLYLSDHYPVLCEF